MNTLEFFQAILPETGPYYLVLMRGGKTSHKPFTTLQNMAAAVAMCDAIPDLTVYHACASYLEPDMRDANGKAVFRKQQNQNRAKALWVDIDCGQDKFDAGKGYLTQRDAAAAVQDFCTKTGMPVPMLVSSGYGLHLYWPMTKAITTGKWQHLADNLKAVLVHLGVKAGPERTADFASILRPVGASNKKLDTWKSVKLLRGAEPVAPEDLWRHLRRIVNTFSVKQSAGSDDLGAMPAHLQGLKADNDDLLAHQYTSVPSYGADIADKCLQFGEMRSTKGVVGYNHWWGVLGVLKFCEDGSELAHEWSKGHKTYSAKEVDDKMESWSKGATTCEKLESDNRSGCVGCPHKGVIKSPIMLGRRVPEPVAIEVSVEVAGEIVEVVIPPMPGDYVWDKAASTFTRFTRDKDGIMQAHVFSKTLYYPVQRVRIETGQYATLVRSHQHKNKIRDFTVDSAALAAPSDLMKILGGKGEIFATNAKDSSMHHVAYLRDSLEALKIKSEEVNTMLNFGWQDDGKSFLLSDRLYRSDGSVVTVMLGANAATHLPHFPAARGNLASYAAAVNAVYSDLSMAPMQYAFTNAYGSILCDFAEKTYNGLLCAVTGALSAKGKTTVCLAGMYGFGEATSMKIDGKKGATDNAAWNMIGCYGNLALTFDELSGDVVTPEWMSNFAYTISGGTEKARMTMRGGIAVAATRVSWRCSPYCNGNDDLHERIGGAKGNTEAEAMRMIQIRIDDYKLKSHQENFVSAQLQIMCDNMGCAGVEFIKFVVSNRATVQGMYDDVLTKITPLIPGAKYRFFRSHAACTLTAAKINSQLGIADFDYDNLFEFTIGLMQKLANDTAESNTSSPEDSFNRMIGELSPRIISTFEYRDARHKSGPEQTVRINSVIAGRLVRGHGDPSRAGPYDGRIYIVKKEMRDWCAKNRAEHNSLVEYAKAEGMLIAESEKFSITRGTEYPNSQQRCIVFDSAKHQSLVPMLGDLRKVVDNSATSDSSNTQVTQVTQVTKVVAA